MSGGDKEELYRRLAQSRRLMMGANAPLTQERLTELVAEMERQLADAEVKNADGEAAALSPQDETE